MLKFQRNCSKLFAHLVHFQQENCRSESKSRSSRNAKNSNSRSTILFVEKLIEHRSNFSSYYISSHQSYYIDSRFFFQHRSNFKREKGGWGMDTKGVERGQNSWETLFFLSWRLENEIYAVHAKGGRGVGPFMIGWMNCHLWFV